MTTHPLLSLTRPYSAGSMDVPLKESTYRKIAEQARLHQRSMIEEIERLVEEGLEGRLEG